MNTEATALEGTAETTNQPATKPAKPAKAAKPATPKAAKKAAAKPAKKAAKPATKPTKAAKGGKATTKATKPAKAAKEATGRKATVVAMISRKGGATLADLMNATGWQAHSVRGLIAILGKGMKITSAKSAAGERTYTAA